MRSVTTILLVTILLCISVAGLYFYSLHIIKETEVTVATTRAELEAAKIKERQVLGLEKVLTETETTRAELAEYFLNENDIVVFLNTLESLGDEMNIVLEIKDVAVTARAGRDVLIIDMTTRGLFSTTYRFLERIEQLPYYVEVTKTFLSAPGQTGDQMWQGQFSITVHSFESETDV